MRVGSRTSRGAEGNKGHTKWAPEVRLKMAQAVVDRGTPLASVSQAFGIPVTTVAEWARRYRKYGTDTRKWAEEGRGKEKRGVRDPVRGHVRPSDPRREAVIRSRKEHPEQGTRRIRDVLARFEGLGVSETTVRRILHEEGLLEEPVQAPTKPRPEERHFERAEPNQLWQSDIFTFLLRRHQRLYVTAFLDDYSRYVVSVVVAHHQRSSLVMEALARGIAEYGAPREVLTDQGRQYVAWRGRTEFEEELRRQGIQHIKSRPHHPQTLGKTERFWKTLWDEFLSRTIFADFEDCQRRIALFVQSYNFRRPHQGIGGAVPADRFFRAAPHVREAIERGVADNALALARERPQQKPFYLVGRFGDRDLSIALTGSGLMVRMGDAEQTIPLRVEGEDEDQATASRRAAEASRAHDPEVASEVGGDRPSGAGAVPAGPLGALGGETGDGCDLGSGDFSGDVLPAGDASAAGDAASAGAIGERGGRGIEPGAADRAPGGEGEGSRAVTPASGASAAHDAPGDEGTGAENRLDGSWQRSFAELQDDEGEGGEASFDPGYDWRGHALTWERKLAGADEASHGQEELHAAAGGGAGSGEAIPDGDGGALGGAVGQRGSEAAGALAEPLSDPASPGAGVPGGGADSEDRGPTPDATTGEGAAGGDGAASTGERASTPAGGDHGSDPERGEWSPTGPPEKTS